MFYNNLTQYFQDKQPKMTNKQKQRLMDVFAAFGHEYVLDTPKPLYQDVDISDLDMGFSHVVGRSDYLSSLTEKGFRQKVKNLIKQLGDKVGNKDLVFNHIERCLTLEDEMKAKLSTYNFIKREYVKVHAEMIYLINELSDQIPIKGSFILYQTVDNEDERDENLYHFYTAVNYLTGQHLFMGVSTQSIKETIDEDYYERNKDMVFSLSHRLEIIRYTVHLLRLILIGEKKTLTTEDYQPFYRFNQEGDKADLARYIGYLDNFVHRVLGEPTHAIKGVLQ